MILMIQPKTFVFGEGLSPEVSDTLKKLENFFFDQGGELT
jgi:hypothetical protein